MQAYDMPTKTHPHISTFLSAIVIFEVLRRVNDVSYLEGFISWIFHGDDYDMAEEKGIRIRGMETKTAKSRAMRRKTAVLDIRQKLTAGGVLNVYMVYILSTLSMPI